MTFIDVLGESKTKRFIPDYDWVDVSSGVGFENSWANYGSTWATAAYRMDAEGWVHIKGFVDSGTANTDIFTLPEEYCPVRTMYFPVVTYNAVGGWCRISPTGEVNIATAGTGSTWQSLAGIQFPTAETVTRETRLWAGSVRTTTGEQIPTLRLRDNGMVVANGIRSSTASAFVIEGQPNGDFVNERAEIFHMADSTTNCRLWQMPEANAGTYYAATTGYSMIEAEYGTPDIADEWIYVNGGVGFSNSWVDYGKTTTEWCPASYWKDQYGFVHLRGLVKSGTLAQAIFTLPTGYRPNGGTERERFCQPDNNGTAPARVDVNDTGTVIIAGGGSTTWTSLSGIHFYAG